ncbi:hypothetical protein [Aeromonas media]|uniref:hypothetical protein n=1 Tax=Aeromonas media TaxID=651 RepID=UPI003D0123D1
MKFSIDKLFHIGLINGWVSGEDDNKDCVYNVTIRTPEKVVYQAQAINFRPDVKSAGLHQTGLCGFSFNAKHFGIREGDLLFVELASVNNEELATHSFLYSVDNVAKQQFDRLEFPRDDFTIMVQNTTSLLRDYPHLLALKILLIRLRRNKRATGWRGQFTGIEYEHKGSDWKLFYYIVSTFREAILSSLSARYLFSITDTIADFSDPLERCAAQSLSMFMYHERFSQTLNPLCKNDSLIYINAKIQYPVWDGMLSNKLEADDALDVYLTRAYENLQSTPLILRFFQTLIIKAMNESNSILYRNLKNSDYFTDAWAYYHAKFNSDLKKDFSSIKI